MMKLVDCERMESLDSMRSASKVTTLAIATLLLAGCVNSPPAQTSPTPAEIAQADGPFASDVLPPCTAPIQGLTTWRMLSAPGFSVCLPGDWRQAARRDASAADGGRWQGGRGRTFEWGIGPFAKGPAQAMPYNDIRQQDLRIGARNGRLDMFGIGTSVTFIAWFPADTAAALPAIRLAGYADGPDARQQVNVIFQSLRPSP